jgi:hypothetical protein
VEVKYKMKKAIFCMIALAIAGLLITSVSSIPVQKSDDTSLDFTIVASSKTPQKISVPTTYLTQAPKDVDRLPIFGDPAFFEVGNQLHPALGVSGAKHMTAYKDEDLANIIWTFSADGGSTYDPGVYYDNGGDYPSIKQWSGTKFHGTYVTDFMDLNGGPTYLFTCYDPTDVDGYEMVFWDWSSYGWSDMIDADIACDSNQEEWEWGISSYVTSTTYGDGYTDGPTITYMDEVTSGSGWISWYYYDGCDHCDAGMDNSIAYSYAVYDYEDTTAGNFKLLCRVNDFAEIMNGYDQMFEIDTGSDLKYPAVAAGDGNIVILAQTNENGNEDIICFYGSDLSSMSSTFVVDTVDDEMYPDVRHLGGDKFMCTYVKGGAIYALTSNDAGATWVDEFMVSDGAEDVDEEYKTSDLSEAALKAMYQVFNGDDSDIYIADVFQNAPPGTPTVNGPAGGSPNKNFDFELTSVDPDGDDVKFLVDYGDGNSEETGFTSSGSPLIVTHKWAEKGTYTITVKAQDTYGSESGEAVHNIVIPRSKSANSMVFRILERYSNLFSIIEYILQNFGL